ncbi:hypothetical protein DPEC_G00028960 [Dallia pectoralis]|uniref:Uncharacterized protein n=1 Tax=Dallia pectoralis TaxID=75939 RepID=A0ACC2HJ41_DALPE|nr:hypothetical protein DPEC_G00028960 [Dallia pectoralis]
MPPPIPPRLGSIKNRAGHSRALLRFLIGMVVLQMLLLLGGFIYLYHMENKYHQELTYKYLDDIIILKRLDECERDNGSLVDCKKLLETYKNVMEKVLQGEGRVANLIGNRPDDVSMARMTVKESKSKSLEWNISHSVRRNVKYYLSSWLEVQQPGNYIIYSQVTFAKWDAKKPLANQVKMRKGTKGEGETLMTAHCSIGSKEKPEKCTAFQSGVFSLEPGDQLSVSVTDPELVNYEQDATTFGLYKL